jgi:hypothetical protein
MVWTIETAKQAGRQPIEKVEEPTSQPANKLKDFCLIQIPLPNFPFSKTPLTRILSYYTTLFMYTLSLLFPSIHFYLFSSFPFCIFFTRFLSQLIGSRVSLILSSPLKKKRWRINRTSKKCNSGRITGISGTPISWEQFRSILHVSTLPPTLTPFFLSPFSFLYFNYSRRFCNWILRRLLFLVVVVCDLKLLIL